MNDRMLFVRLPEWKRKTFAHPINFFSVVTWVWIGARFCRQGSEVRRFTKQQPRLAAMAAGFADSMVVPFGGNLVTNVFAARKFTYRKRRLCSGKGFCEQPFYVRSLVWKIKQHTRKQLFEVRSSLNPLFKTLLSRKLALEQCAKKCVICTKKSLGFE